MLDEFTILFLSLWFLVVAIFGYSSYWAFIIRRALVQRLYRRQAWWVGWMAIYFVALSTFLTLALTFNVNLLPINILGGLLISSGFIVLFLWIDSTIRVARRSDPLYRDTARWSKLRYFWGLATVGGAIGALFDSITSGFNSVAPFSGALFFGAITLLLSAKRSGDPTLRRHLKWTGLCIFILWLGNQIIGPLFNLISDAYFVESIALGLVGLSAYSLYRSARSLAPISHLSTIAPSGLQQLAETSL